MKTIVITGTDTGLSLALVELSLARGDRVMAACLDPEGDGTQSLRERHRDRVTLVPLDLRSAKSVRGAAAQISSVASTVDWLINNAGILGDIERTVGDPELDFAGISDAIQINAVGSLRVIHELWGPLVASHKPLIV